MTECPECPICMETMCDNRHKKHVLLICGHVICNNCQINIRSPLCPICKTFCGFKYTASFFRSYVLHNHINGILFDMYSPEVYILLKQIYILFEYIFHYSNICERNINEIYIKLANITLLVFDTLNLLYQFKNCSLFNKKICTKYDGICTRDHIPVSCVNCVKKITQGKMWINKKNCQPSMLCENCVNLYNINTYRKIYLSSLNTIHTHKFLTKLSLYSKKLYNYKQTMKSLAHEKMNRIKMLENIAYIIKFLNHYQNFVDETQQMIKKNPILFDIFASTAQIEFPIKMEYSRLSIPQIFNFRIIYLENNLLKCPSI